VTNTGSQVGERYERGGIGCGQQNKGVVSGGKQWLFSFLLREHGFCVHNWITADFTPQIQINT
jgi:hypothetical protein